MSAPPSGRTPVCCTWLQVDGSSPHWSRPSATRHDGKRVGARQDRGQKGEAPSMSELRSVRAFCGRADSTPSTMPMKALLLVSTLVCTTGFQVAPTRPVRVCAIGAHLPASSSRASRRVAEPAAGRVGVEMMAQDQDDRSANEDAGPAATSTCVTRHYCELTHVVALVVQLKISFRSSPSSVWERSSSLVSALQSQRA